LSTFEWNQLAIEKQRRPFPISIEKVALFEPVMDSEEEKRRSCSKRTQTRKGERKNRRRLFFDAREREVLEGGEQSRSSATHSLLPFTDIHCRREISWTIHGCKGGNRKTSVGEQERETWVEETAGEVAMKSERRWSRTYGLLPYLKRKALICDKRGERLRDGR